MSRFLQAARSFSVLASESDRGKQLRDADTSPILTSGEKVPSGKYMLNSLSLMYNLGGEKLILSILWQNFSLPAKQVAHKIA
jgi:hypothetical protein